MGFRRWIPLILVAITLLCFGRLFNAEFTYLDDNYTVEANPRLNPPSFANVKSFWPPFLPSGEVNAVYDLYMPLTYTFWSAVAVVATPVGDLNPYIFHIANVLLHALSGVLVYRILRHLLWEGEAPAEPIVAHARLGGSLALPSCFGALLFLLHPVQVESVAWISGAKDLLAGLTALAALWQYLLFADASASGPLYLTRVGKVGLSARWRALHYGLMLLATAGAMFAKPSAVTVPLILLAVDLLVIRRGVRKPLIALSPAFAMMLFFAFLGVKGQPLRDVNPVPLYARPFMVGDTLCYYLLKILVPLNLAVDYGRRPSVVMATPWFYVAWIAPLILAALILRARERRPLLLCGAIVFVLAGAPTLGLTRFGFQRYSTTADHYLYLPMLGIAMIGAELLRVLTRTRAREAEALAEEPDASSEARLGTSLALPCARTSISVSTLVLILLAGLTLRQTGFWMNSRTLFEHALDVNPRSFMAHLNLAIDALARKDYARAEQLLADASNSAPYSRQSVEQLEIALAGMRPTTRPTP